MKGVQLSNNKQGNGAIIELLRSWEAPSDSALRHGPIHSDVSLSVSNPHLDSILEELAQDFLPPYYVIDYV